MKDKQIEEMAEHIYDFGNLRFGEMYCYDDAERVSEKLYNAGYRKQSEWISVEERLPTDEREVLAYYGFDHRDGDLGRMFVGVLSYFAYDPNPHFQHESLGLRVTHWMPLPEPPKMKGGE